MVLGHLIARLSAQSKHIVFAAVFLNVFTQLDSTDLTWDFTTQDKDKTLKLIPVIFMDIAIDLLWYLCSSLQSHLEPFLVMLMALNQACPHRMMVTPASKE